MDQNLACKSLEKNKSKPTQKTRYIYYPSGSLTVYPIAVEPIGIYFFIAVVFMSIFGK